MKPPQTPLHKQVITAYVFPFNKNFHSSFLSNTSSLLTQAMAEEIFYKICHTIKCGKPEVFEFTHLPSVDSNKVLEGLFYHPNHLEEHCFR